MAYPNFASKFEAKKNTNWKKKLASKIDLARKWAMLVCIHGTLCFPISMAGNVSKVVQLFCNGPSGHYPIT